MSRGCRLPPSDPSTSSTLAGGNRAARASGTTLLAAPTAGTASGARLVTWPSHHNPSVTVASPGHHFLPRRQSTVVHPYAERCGRTCSLGSVVGPPASDAGKRDAGFFRCVRAEAPAGPAIHMPLRECLHGRARVSLRPGRRLRVVLRATPRRRVGTDRRPLPTPRAPAAASICPRPHAHVAGIRRTPPPVMTGPVLGMPAPGEPARETGSPVTNDPGCGGWAVASWLLTAGGQPPGGWTGPGSCRGRPSRQP
jgi:hypothetical protein